MKKTIAFIINPIAGIGGKVGLKGSDNVLEEALKRGGEKISAKRAADFFENIKGNINKINNSKIPGDINFLTCSGVMGKDVIKKFTKNYEILYYLKNNKTTSEDTKKACEIFLEKDIDLLVFCGGDGTARDVSFIVSEKVPVLGIPSGVKMYSSCFAVTPEAAAKVFVDFIKGKTKLKDAEILDIDEDAYRKDMMNVKLFSHVKTPYVHEYVQGAKAVFLSQDEEISKTEIALFCIEFMRDSSLYLVGPGTTTKKIFELLGLEKTLLGVDAVKDEKLVAKDLNEKEILRLIEKYDRVKIIISPLGKQGFIFGRGNQQISDKVMDAVGADNIIIIATPQKLHETKKLFVDTGNAKVNKMLSGRRLVVCGYAMAQRKDVLSL